MTTWWRAFAASAPFVLASATSATAEPILKCTDASGGVEYRNSPCPAGRNATIIDVPEAPPASEAERRLEAVRRESAEMTARLSAEAIARREAMTRTAYASGVYVAPQLEAAPADDAYIPLYGGYFPYRPCRAGSGCAMKPKRSPAPVQTARAAPTPTPLPVRKR